MLANSTFTPTNPGISIWDTWHLPVGLLMLAVAAVSVVILWNIKEGSKVYQFMNRFGGWVVAVVFALAIGGFVIATISTDVKKEAVNAAYTDQFETHLRDAEGVTKFDGLVKKSTRRSAPGDNQIFVNYKDGSEGLVLYKFDGKKVTYRFLPVTAAEGL